MQNFSNYLKKKIIIKDIFNIKEAEMYKNLFDTYISKSRPIKNKILPMDGIGYIFLIIFLLMK